MTVKEKKARRVSAAQDESSDSLSPPTLLPEAQGFDSDFEENVEDPPDLDIYSSE